ncbi:hypothetical protein C6P40_002558, partial [Pichia californica]
MDTNDRRMKKGVQFFKEEKYEDCIKIFRVLIQSYKLEFSKQKEQLLKQRDIKIKQNNLEASKIFSKNFVNASDCISAAYLKINKPKDALRYAKAMIIQQPFGCKGYLRL